MIVPVVALLAVGTVDLGRAYSVQNRLRNAAREGARFAQYAPEQVTTTGVCTAPDSITYMADHEDGVNTFTVTVEKVPTAGSPITLTGCKTLQDPAATVHPGDHVRVNVTSPFSVLTPVVNALVGNTITLSGSEEVVVQGQ